MTWSDSTRNGRSLLMASLMLAAASASVGSSAMAHGSTAQPAALPHSTASAGALVLSDRRCLTEAIYYEARGEGPPGEEAVAEVVLNRTHSGRRKRSICAVVYQGVARAGCQFSFACDGSRMKQKCRQAWRQAADLAARILSGRQPLNGLTGGATYYHALSVRPYWADALIRTVRIGHHVFYRAAARSERG